MALTLEDLFRKLSYGELSNLAVAVDATGGIKRDQQNRIIQFANEALMRMHSRFPLIEESAAFTIGDADQDITLDPDVLLVTSIFTSWGQSLAIQNKPIYGSIYVYGGKLHLPAVPAGTDPIDVQAYYQKRHPTLVTANPLDLTQTITLMAELEEALTAYIGFKMYSGMNTQDAMAAAAQYKNRYEQVLAEALNQGLLPGELMPNRKLDLRGFV